MKLSLLFRLALVSVLLGGCSQITLAQDQGGPSVSDKPARTMTNDDFGSLKPPEPAPAPAKAKPSVTTKNIVQKRRYAPFTSNEPQQPVTEAAKDPEKTEAVEETPRPRAELNVKKDASGNWVLTCTSVAADPKQAGVAFSDLSVSTGKPELDQLIQEAGQKYGVDPRLILEVMRQESGFHEYATSPAGARGLMQFMPGTGYRYGITNLYDPKQSIDAGARYLRDLLDMFHGDVALALAGYNAGEHRVIRSGYQVPQISETQNYVRNITKRYGSTKHYGVKSTVKKNEPPPPPPMRVEKTNDGHVFLTNH